MDALSRVIDRLEERITNGKKYGSHPQYIEGLRDTLDMIKDETE
jgi:hypothetical protein